MVDESDRFETSALHTIFLERHFPWSGHSGYTLQVAEYGVSNICCFTQHLFIVWVYYFYRVYYVIHGTIANFNIVFVKDFVVLVGFTKMFMYEA